MNFTFQENGHIYRRHDGQICCSVTQTIQRSGQGPDYSRVPALTLEWKQNLGRIIHSATHYFDEQDLIWETLDPEAVPYVQAWERFRRDSGFVPYWCGPRQNGALPSPIEYQAIAEIDGMSFGLRVDRLGVCLKRPDGELHWAPEVDAHPELFGEPYQLDIKSTVLEDEKAWRLQAAGYKLGVPRPIRFPYHYKSGFIQLFPDGSWKPFWYDDPADLDAFRHALAVVTWGERIR
jgi:hypothetical protein